MMDIVQLLILEGHREELVGFHRNNNGILVLEERITLDHPIESFISDLKRATWLDLSYDPELHVSEKYYKLVGYNLFETSTGFLLILELQNEKGVVTFSYPDIQTVELNHYESEEHRKYYLKCIVRSIDSKYKYYTRRNRSDITNEELDFLEENKDVIYRITLKFKQ